LISAEKDGSFRVSAHDFPPPVQSFTIGPLRRDLPVPSATDRFFHRRRRPTYCGTETMRREQGFTLLELSLAIAVLGFVCALAAPNIIAWRNRARIDGAALRVLSIFQEARIQAVKRNAPVWVYFDSEQNRYRIHFDDSAGSGRGDGLQDEDETVIRGEMPAGIYLASVSRSPVDFNSRGIPYFGTTVTLADKGGRRRRIIVSPSGHSRIDF